MTIEIRIIHQVAPPRYCDCDTELLTGSKKAVSIQEFQAKALAIRLPVFWKDVVRFKPLLRRFLQKQRILKTGFWVITGLVIWRFVKLCSNLLDAYGVAQLAGYCVTSLWRWL